MTALAWLQTDPLSQVQQQNAQAANALAGLGMGFIAVGMLFGVLVSAFFVFLLWRIFTRAGMSGALSLLAIIPMIGPIIVLCLLAFGDWKVVPATGANLYGGPPPFPPGFPPASYPPSNLPPANYPPSDYPPSGQV